VTGRAAGAAGARFFIVTLGCPKNEADSDALGVLLRRAGHTPAGGDAADVVIVNTCGFIDAAKEESIETVLEAADVVRRTGARLAVCGCLVSLHREELARELPEVDLFTAFDYAPLLELLASVAADHDGTAVSGARPRVGPAGDAAGVARRQRPVHAFVKISDGCDQRCAFCAIPLIKGPYVAVPPDEVLAAAARALAAGAREIVLVGQDTSRWSWPGYGDLGRLLAELKCLGVPWVRLLYLQPQGVTGALLDALAMHAVPYIDLPLQHADGAVLSRMGRAGDDDAYLALLASVRDRLPNVAVRSTFLVGHPGEEEAAFDRLEAFVHAAGLAVAGVFVFDPQAGTRSHEDPDRVPIEVAEERAARLAAAIEEASRPFWDGLIGRELDVLVERGTHSRGGEAVGRIVCQAPDVDGQTILTGRAVRRGDLVRARITAVTGYEVHAVADEVRRLGRPGAAPPPFEDRA
jgi:ribosomal protein S12 methylthiotransferase